MIKKIEKYSAEWCGPCKVLGKTLETVLKDYPDIEFVEFDADENEKEFEEKGIRNVPQLFFYNEDGSEVHHLTGAYPANKLKDIIDYHNHTKEDYDPSNPEYVEKKNE